MKDNHIAKSRVRKYFLNNPNNSLEELSNKFELPKSTIQGYLTNKEELNIVASQNESNLYFLFSNLMERKIVTENDGRTIINSFDFNFNEKIFMRSFGFVI